eukprot:s433_g14.t1
MAPMLILQHAEKVTRSTLENTFRLAPSAMCAEQLRQSHASDRARFALHLGHCSKTRWHDRKSQDRSLPQVQTRSASASQRGAEPRADCWQRAPAISRHTGTVGTDDGSQHVKQMLVKTNWGKLVKSSHVIQSSSRARFLCSAAAGSTACSVMSGNKQ